MRQLPAGGDDTNARNTPYRGNFSKAGAMASREYFEQAATSIGTLKREELKRQIRNFKGQFKLDFTEDYLNDASVDRLRHILFAALISANPHR
ncbi:MAG: hypothetical protein MUP16_06845 [Sedimentisphaerales bacterium]|nr:hypothetical protein [Sedimentisphaerales bacterium]